MRDFLNEDIVVMNFSNVYEIQDFKDAKDICYEDVSDITGTDCYCDEQAARSLRERIEKYSYRGIHYIDSGNYHYMSRIWLDKADVPFVLVVFDNHPDAQSPAFGDILSCGGWIKTLLENNSFLEKAVVIGVNGELLGELDDDVRGEIDAGRLHFITRQEIAEAQDCSADGCEDLYEDIYDIGVKNFIGHDKSVYISIDKDVLDESIVRTNWDQGDMRMNEMVSYIKCIADKNKIIGVDVCGEPPYENGGDEEIIIRSNRVNSYILNMLKNL